MKKLEPGDGWADNGGGGSHELLNQEANYPCAARDTFPPDSFGPSVFLSRLEVPDDVEEWPFRSTEESFS